jgi:hypothetical protein
MKHVPSLGVCALVLAWGGVASAAIIGPWPAASSQMWETQPAGYTTSPNVSIVAPDVLQTQTGGVGKTLAVPRDDSYGGTESSWSRWTVAELVGASNVTSLHAKVYDPDGSGKHGFTLVLQDNAGQLLDFGIWTLTATGKIYPMQYDGSSWVQNLGYYSRYKTGNDYYIYDITQDGSGYLHWTFQAYTGATLQYSVNGTSTLAYGSIDRVWLAAAKGDTNTAINYKWTEFSWVPEPATLVLVGVGGLFLRRRR